MGREAKGTLTMVVVRDDFEFAVEWTEKIREKMVTRVVADTRYRKK
jgi:hypothetical protein